MIASTTRRKSEPAVRGVVRCAVYTRKSTEEGLDSDFNSLDAQREAGEAYIASQKSKGWACLPARYDDGGYTGGNMDRPAFQRLMADVEAGQIDCIVVYKVDRLSRSLLDFARIIETLDAHRVSFVSVTQQFDTTTSMGRLTLNVLLSFAQFEREIISERTRDKIAAARRKGKWIGGRPILGYDVAPGGGKVVINEDEAVRVREIFRLYLEHEALLPAVQELNRRGWTIKRWTARKGHECGGQPFDKCSLFRLLTNVAYVGKVRYKDEVHDGEHPAIIDESVWQRVQATLRRNGRSGGTLVRNKYGALLKGLLYCTPCGHAMVHSYTAKGKRQYRYYVCTKAQKQGWEACPTKSIPAGEIERFVVDRIRQIGKNPALVAATFAEARRQTREGIEAMERERNALGRELQHDNEEVRRLVSKTASDRDGGTPATVRLADLQDRIRSIEGRMMEVNEQIMGLGQNVVDENELAAALAQFDPVWESLSSREQAKVIRLLVERVGYDRGAGTVSLTFRAAGIKELAAEAVGEEVEV